MGDLKSDLARDRELIETHISWVFLDVDTVIKVKKPVSLGFLDFSTPEKRRAACEREIALNQRLSHDVYRDVVPVTLGEDGIHRIGGDGAIVDYGVRMARLADGQRADILLSNGELTRDHILRIARRLANFHAAADRSEHIDSFGRVSTIRQNVVENFHQTEGLSTHYISPRQEREIEQAQLGFLEQERDLFRQRIRDGKIRDGHGDLRLEHIYFSEGGLNIIDCIEFNDRFRYGDVCADLAFLTMDLGHQGGEDFAEDLLAEYARCCGDYDLYGLVDFYAGYRAYVRAKVASFLAGDEQAAETVRTAAEQKARSYYLHALTAQRSPVTRPVVVAVGGLIASGKSHTSERLSRLLHCPVVDTDRTRKYLLGVDFESRIEADAFSGAYSPGFSERVYHEVLRRAEVVLRSQRSVIIDASFRTAESRVGAGDLAARHGAPFCFIECRVPRETALERLREREHHPGVSDARAGLYDEFASRWEPATPTEQGQWLSLDTSLNDATITGILEEHFAPLSRPAAPGPAQDG